MSWDAFQREALAELGLQPYAVASHRPSAALMQALARAADCAPAQLAGVPGVERLRSDAKAKRALWPQLRRMRAHR